VFVIRRQQVDAPNHPAITNYQFIILKVFVKAGCPSGAPLRYAVCHAACSSSSFLTAATVSFTPLRSFLPALRLITPRSQLYICCKAGHPIARQ